MQQNIFSRLMNDKVAKTLFLIRLTTVEMVFLRFVGRAVVFAMFRLELWCLGDLTKSAKTEISGRGECEAWELMRIPIDFERGEPKPQRLRDFEDT